MNERLKSSRGFSLLEALISMFLFGIVMSGLTPAFAAMLRFNTNAQIQTEAIAVAQRVLDEKRELTITSLPTGGVEYQTITVDGRAYVTTLTYCVTAAYCASVNSRHLRISVDQNGTRYFQTETVFTQLD